MYELPTQDRKITLHTSSEEFTTPDRLSDADLDRVAYPCRVEWRYDTYSPAYSSVGGVGGRENLATFVRDLLGKGAWDVSIIW